MHSFYGTRLSENMAETPEGYLICYDVKIARIGTQDYLGSELGVSDDIVKVNRPAEEVFSKATLASFEGKPFTNDHPYNLLDVNNTPIYEKGHIQNVRVSDDKIYLIADIMVKDSQTIQDIKNGKRELSAGYNCDCLQDEDGNWYQANIIGNHVALVDKGRAGEKVRINDAEWNEADHPRAKNGQFGKGGGESSVPKQEKSESGDSPELKEALEHIVNKYNIKSSKELMQLFGNENNLKLAVSNLMENKRKQQEQSKGGSTSTSEKKSESGEKSSYEKRVEEANKRSEKQSGGFDDEYEADIDYIAPTLREELKNPRSKDMKFALGKLTSGYNDNTHLERAIMAMDDVGLFITNDIGDLNRVQKALKEVGIETVWREQRVGKAFMMPNNYIVEKRLFFNGNQNYLETKSLDFEDNETTKEKPMKDSKSVLGKLLKAFAKDAEPEEMVEALEAVKGNDEEPDRLTKLETMVQDLCARMDAYDEATKKEEPEMTALDEVEKELEDEEPEEKKEVEDEDAKNDPKLIEALEEKAQEDEDTTEEIKKEIADAKKVIAKIADKETRLAVADSLAKVIRGKIKSSDNYKKLMDASNKKSVVDSKAIDYKEVFKKIKDEKFRK